MMDDAVHGDFLQQHVAEGARHLEDIAFSGNGEPTSSAEFPRAVSLVEGVLRDCGLLGRIKVRLITNGSLLDRPGVLGAITELARCNGEVWFKVDAATPEGFALINDVSLKPEGVLLRLRACSARCPTWVQTCVFALDGQPPAETDSSGSGASFKTMPARGGRVTSREWERFIQGSASATSFRPPLPSPPPA